MTHGAVAQDVPRGFSGECKGAVRRSVEPVACAATETRPLWLPELGCIDDARPWESESGGSRWRAQGRQRASQMKAVEATRAQPRQAAGVSQRAYGRQGLAAHSEPVEPRLRGEPPNVSAAQRRGRSQRGLSARSARTSLASSARTQCCYKTVLASYASLSGPPSPNWMRPSGAARRR